MRFDFVICKVFIIAGKSCISFLEAVEHAFLFWKPWNILEIKAEDPETLTLKVLKSPAKCKSWIVDESTV